MKIEANSTKKDLLNKVYQYCYQELRCADYIKNRRYKLLYFNEERQLKNYLKLLDLFDFVKTHTEVLDNNILYVSNRSRKDAQFTFRLARQFLANNYNNSFNEVIEEAFKENTKNEIWFKLCYLININQKILWSDYTDIINKINILLNKYRNYDDLKNYYLKHFRNYSSICSRSISPIDNEILKKVNINPEYSWSILSNRLSFISYYIDESKGIISFEDFVKYFCDEQ